MPPYFVLGLDTHAPVITWGDVTGADAGEILVVHYTIDEPRITSATLTFADGSTLPMLVEAANLSVGIPGDARMGPATVSATVEDDVGNTATRTLAVAMGGVIPPVPMPSAGGLPHGAEAGPRLIRDRSSAGASSRDRVRAHVSSPSSAQARSHYSGPTHRVVRTRDGAAGRSTDQISGRVTSRSSVQAATQPDAIRRREGPDHQAELILLDIL